MGFLAKNFKRRWRKHKKRCEAKVWKCLFKHHFIREREWSVCMRPTHTHTHKGLLLSHQTQSPHSQRFPALDTILMDFAAGKYSQPPRRFKSSRSDSVGGQAWHQSCRCWLTPYWAFGGSWGCGRGWAWYSWQGCSLKDSVTVCVCVCVWRVGGHV